MAFHKYVNMHTEVLLKRMLLRKLKPSKVTISSFHQSPPVYNVLMSSNKSAGQKKKFIPMTRKTLIRKLMENEHLVASDNREMFYGFSIGLESSMSREFHKVLMELKQLYDPLNPDKETLMVYHVGRKQKQEQEFWLLQKLSDLLEKAHFEELPREEIREALDEHPVYEGVMVKVDLKKFDVIRIWALGEENKALEHQTYRDWIRNKFFVMTKSWPESVSTYRRIVVAVRHKNQNKLFLKAFKDIPKNSLEYILPEGKISISKYDKSLIATTVTIGGVTLVTRIISSFADYNLSWTSIVAGTTGLLALRSWNAYKNKRNMYLVNLVKSFYYKTLANNRALLTLVVDRSEDEVFKAAILAYAFIRMENTVRGVYTDHSNGHYMNKMVTVSELNASIESWMRLRHKVDITFDCKYALQHLEKLRLLKYQKLGDEIHVDTLALEDALRMVPRAPLISLSDRDEELDVEDIVPDTDVEKADLVEKEKQRLAEMNTTGWQ